MRGGRRLAKLTSRVSLGIPHERFFSSLDTVATALLSAWAKPYARGMTIRAALSHTGRKHACMRG